MTDGQQLIQLLKKNRPSWQSLPGSLAEQLLVRLVMLIERRTALPEVLPWLWPLADEDSGCKVNAEPSLRIRLLSALIAVPEAMDNAVGGKVRHCACRMTSHVGTPEAWSWLLPMWSAPIYVICS